MDLAFTLGSGVQQYVAASARQQLSPYASLLGGNVGLPVSLSASTSSSASSGPSKSGDISGGTAFNIGGINLGQQYESPATASGGNPAQSLASAAFGGYTPIILIGALAIAALIILRR